VLSGRLFAAGHQCKSSGSPHRAAGTWDGVAVLLKIYAHCIHGQADAENKRITDALGAQDTGPEPEPGDEGDGDIESAS